MNLVNKTAVVVGASTGLGKEVAVLLAQEKANVFALARTIEKIMLPPSVIKIPFNIRDVQSIDAAFAQIDKQTKNIDILINCAGRGLMKPFEETTREEIMDVLGINLKGNIYTALEVYKRMIPKNSGHIVNIISTSGLKAREMETIYCASKWGLRGFTDSLQLAAKSHGIRVTGVYPGGMKSDNFWKIIPGKDISSFMDPKLIAEQIVSLLKTDPSLSPTELVIERM